MKIATPTSWSTNPLSVQRQALHVVRDFSPEEFTLIQRGIIPRDMDEKWFIYYLDNVLHFHRSWTGNEIYQLDFDTSNSAVIKTTHCWVTRDPSQYKGTDDAEDVATLLYLIDELLLNQQEGFPHQATLSPEQAAALRHNVVGNGRPNIS